MKLEFFDNPQAFLDVAGELLAAEPVLGSVIASYTERVARELADGRDSWPEAGAPFDRWWLVVRDDAGTAVSAAMRTAPFTPWPSYSLPMSDEAAALLATALHDRGEVLGGCNGALPGAGALAAETARLAGVSITVDKHTRLWEATSVTPAPVPEGTLRLATEEDVDLALDWFRRFHAEADEQAGREPHADSGEHATVDSVLVRIREDAIWLWELPGGEVVHLTGANLPSFGVARIGPVYTPRLQRGRGIASHVVGELTRRGLAAGHRMCLFTDQANPTSNKIYAGLGYRPVTDMAEHLVGPED